MATTSVKGSHLSSARRTIERVVRNFPGRVGVYIEDVDTLEGFGVDTEGMYPMASICKLPLMITLYRLAQRRKLDLARTIGLGARQRVHGSGLFQYMKARLSPTLRDLVIMMIAVSDNEATDLLFRIAPPRAVSAQMRALGLPDIHVNRLIGPLIAEIRALYAPKFRAKTYAQQAAIIKAQPAIFDELSKARLWRGMHRIFNGRDCCSPRAMARLCSLLQRGELANTAATRDMISILEMQCYSTGLPRRLPNTASVAHKTGSWDGVANDAGIITAPPRRKGGPKRHASVAVFSWARNVEVYRAKEMIGAIGRAVWDALSC